MANYPRWIATMTLRDYALRDSIVQFYVPEATAKLYFAAADKAARDATAIGQLFTKLIACSQMTEVQQQVSVIDETAPVAPLLTETYRGNKVVLYGQAGPDGWTMSIPGRDPDAFTPKTDSIEIDIEAAGDLKTFISALEATCVGKNGLSLDVQSAVLND